MLKLKQMYEESMYAKEEMEESYKVVVLGRDPVEVSARSPEEAIEKANIPSNWIVMQSGKVITAHPKVYGGCINQ